MNLNTTGLLYLDHAASAPLAPEVVSAMAPWLAPGAVGNPSSLHAAGRQARKAVEDARDRVAAALGVAALDVLFTSGGTEADNQACKGVVLGARGRHMVTTAIEHHAVLESAAWLAGQGCAVSIVVPGPDGVVDPDAVLAEVRDDTALVSVMAVNNELGTVQPLDVLGPALAQRGVPLHTDAVQALGRVPLDVTGWGLGALSLSAHKLGGPHGVGVLVLRRDLDAVPVLHGGGQERGVRSGTLATALIVGCGAAVALACTEGPAESLRLRRLRDLLCDELLAVPGVRRTVDGPTSPHHAHVAVDGCDGEALLLALDRLGVACSTGSACQSGAAEPSHVLTAIGARLERTAYLRFSLGRTTTELEVKQAAVHVAAAIRTLRDAGGGFA